MPKNSGRRQVKRPDASSRANAPMPSGEGRDISFSDIAGRVTNIINMTSVVFFLCIEYMLVWLITLRIRMVTSVENEFSENIDNSEFVIVKVKKVEKNNGRRPSIFYLDWLLPARHATTTIDAMEDLYEERWLPRHGPRKAKLIFHTHACGTILRVHWKRIEKTALVVLAALGLDSIIKVFRKP